MACIGTLPQNMTFKRALFILQDGRCPYCGRGMIFIERARRKHLHNLMATFEHVHPRRKGGDNSFENRMLVCHECNHRRGDGPVQIGMYVVRRKRG